MPKIIKSDDITNALAKELAIGLLSKKQIRKLFGLTKRRLKNIMRDPTFLTMYEEQVQLWKSPGNTLERIRQKSQMAVEDTLVDIHKIITSKDSSAKDKLDANRMLGKFAGAESRPVEGTPGSATDGEGGFSITINYRGEDPKVIEGRAILDDDGDIEDI